jgi:hypothetical protein
MELITIDTYLYIGGRLRYLIQAKEGYPLYSLSHDAVLDNMKKLSHDIHTHQFKTTKSSKSFNDFNNLLREWENRPPDYTLDKYDVTELNKICKNIEEIILSECRDKIVFKVLDKRIDPQKLLFKPPSLLPQEVYSKLPQIAQYDFSQACQCIAFDLPTAAAFHLMRCIEGSLRKYYTNLTGNDAKGLVWGGIIKQLHSLTSNQPPKEVLDVLDNIRDNYRNPTQHPDAVYDIEQVQTLFGICTAALSMISKSL